METAALPHVAAAQAWHAQIWHAQVWHASGLAPLAA
jgi:hypothetical protein